MEEVSRLKNDSCFTNWGLSSLKYIDRKVLMKCVTELYYRTCRIHGFIRDETGHLRRRCLNSNNLFFFFKASTTFGQHSKKCSVHIYVQYDCFALQLGRMVAASHKAFGGPCSHLVSLECKLRFVDLKHCQALKSVISAKSGQETTAVFLSPIYNLSFRKATLCLVVSLFMSCFVI